MPETLLLPREGLEDALFDALYDSAGLMGVATRKAAKACVAALESRAARTKITPTVAGAIKLLESNGFTVMRCKPGELHPLSEEEAHCGVTLFRRLKERGPTYAAVKVDGPLNWSITEPRTQEALLAALETDEFDHVCQQETDEREDEVELHDEAARTPITSSPEELDEEALVLLMLGKLHEHVSENDRPMSMSDLSDEQTDRARKAVRAVIVAACLSKPAGRYASIAELEAALTAKLNSDTDETKPDGSSFVWKWVERAIFDDMLPANECLSTLAHYPGAPWNLGRWDVDHKPYAAMFYAQFPKALAERGERRAG